MILCITLNLKIVNNTSCSENYISHMYCKKRKIFICLIFSNRKKFLDSVILIFVINK